MVAPHREKSAPGRVEPATALFCELMLGFPIHAAAVVAAILTLLPFLLAAFWPFGVEAVQRVPLAVRIVLPAMLCVPYAMVAISYGQFRWGWFALVPAAAGGD